MSFQQFNLHPNILKVLDEEGYSKPTPIQENAIPKILEGCDLFASAQTGTGKTAAFMLPSIQKLSTPSTLKGRGPRILVLVPTRELAMQVATQSVKYSKYLQKMTTVCLYGGAPYPIQNRQLARPHEILVATPGRLIDHLESKRVDFSRVEMFILDEADRMLDMGFIEAVEHIAEQIPQKVQTLLFSATLKRNVLKLAQHLLKDPLELHIKPEIKEHANIQQFLYHTPNIGKKRELLDSLLTQPDVRQVVIFSSTKSYAAQLSKELCELGHRCEALHGDLHQRKRTKTINAFREGKVNILVATDVAARGLDVKDVSHVINFDLPNNAEDYVHRIGRTGRAEAKGIAISFVSNKDRHLIKDIEKLLEISIQIIGDTGKNTEQRTDSKPSTKPRSSRPPFFKKKPSPSNPVRSNFANKERRFDSETKGPERKFNARPFPSRKDPERRFDSETKGPERKFNARPFPSRKDPERRFDSETKGPERKFNARPFPSRKDPERTFDAPKRSSKKEFDTHSYSSKKGPERKFNPSAMGQKKKPFFQQKNDGFLPPMERTKPKRNLGRFEPLSK